MAGDLRSFAALDELIGRVPAEVVVQLQAVDIGRGSEGLYRDQLPGLLQALADRARVASSCGRVVSDGSGRSSVWRRLDPAE